MGGISSANAKSKDGRTEDEKLIEGLMGKAEVLYFSGEYDKALNMFEAVINIDPKNHKAWNKKGIALEKLGRTIEEILHSPEKAKKKALGLGWWNKYKKPLSYFGAIASIIALIFTLWVYFNTRGDLIRLKKKKFNRRI